MNEHFVNIKVDREERPDLDQIYMAAVQAIDRPRRLADVGLPDARPQAVLRRDLLPADRLPRDARLPARAPRACTRPGTSAGARSTGSAGRDDRAAPGDRAALPPTGRARSTPRCSTRPRGRCARAFDPTHGGFGSAPKFPHPMDLKVLLRQHARTGDAHALHMVRHTLDKMARGGIYDHLGGGFARYSTDDALAGPALREDALRQRPAGVGLPRSLPGDRATPEFARVARETMDYVLGRMTGPEGAFYSTEDADSEGVEGKYYVWTLAEISEVLGPERGQDVRLRLRRDRAGNWEAQNILNLPKTIAQAAKLLGRDEDELRAELAEDRARLLAVRDRRVPPGKDTKVLTSWNGLMIAALAEGGPDLEGRRATSRPPAGPPASCSTGCGRRRPAAPHLQGRPGQAQRLPRRLRQPDRRPDAAVRGDRRAALDRVGAGAGRGDDRRVRRPRARRVLLHRARATRR